MLRKTFLGVLIACQWRTIVGGGDEPCPTPSPDDVNFFSLYGCDNECGDFANDCYAPRTELKTCKTSGKTAYVSSSEDEPEGFAGEWHAHDSYVCCDTQPEGFDKFEATGLGVQGTAAWVSVLVAIVVLSFATGCYRMAGWSGTIERDIAQGRQFVSPEAEIAAKSALNQVHVLLLVSIAHYITGGIVVDPGQFINLPGTLIICSIFICKVKGDLKDDHINSFGCLKCCFSVFILGTIVLGIILVVIAATTIPGVGLMLAFYPSILFTEIMLLKDLGTLERIFNANGHSFYGSTNTNASTIASTNATTSSVPTAEARPAHSSIAMVHVQPASSAVTGSLVKATPVQQVGLGGTSTVGAAAIQSNLSVSDRLRELNEARENNLLSEQEYDAARRAIIGI